jgi:hypothetical protein
MSVLINAWIQYQKQIFFILKFLLFCSQKNTSVPKCIHVVAEEVQDEMLLMRMGELISYFHKLLF